MFNYDGIKKLSVLLEVDEVMQVRAFHRLVRVMNLHNSSVRLFRGRELDTGKYTDQYYLIDQALYDEATRLLESDVAEVA